MLTLYVTLKPIDSEWVNLRYWLDVPGDQHREREEKKLRLAEIQSLIDQGELHYYVVRPNLPQVGQQLYRWLDGEGRWLQQAIDRASAQGLVLAIAAEGRLAHLPWEVLHDGTGFLVTRTKPIVPVRWVEQPSKENLAPMRRSLQVMFMATSPEGVEPPLNFEQEEAEILRITEQLPLLLRVEESGCVAEMGKLWRKYPEGYFDVFHLTGHASIRAGQPYFITETLTGDRQDATAADLIKAFEYRLPRLVFLSGCRTAQAGNEGSLGSMAEQLVRQGVPAVLGWGRPVLDTVATAAAAHLYERLAEGYSIAQAVGSTYGYLQQEQVRDWHLLRFCIGGTAWGALVDPPEYYIPEAEPIRSQFLDPEQQVRVATPEQFVGRRRLLQRSLQQLQLPTNLGVLLYGMGGAGKSTIAARLLERMPDYTPIVIHRDLDERVLLDRLARQCTSEAGHQILQGNLPLMQRLTRFWREGLNQPKQKFCLVLDDFEANLELRLGEPVLTTQVVEPFKALLQSIGESRMPHRVILTSRYDFAIPNLNHRLHREPVSALRGADLSKKYDRLDAFKPQSQVDAELQKRAKTLADGNPRLLEWLDKLLLVPNLDTTPIFDRMDTVADRFREGILAEEVLKQQPDDLKHLLTRSAVFHLPVPDAALVAICTGIEHREQHRDRAVSLGLLEFAPASTGSVYRVPQLLVPLLPPAQLPDLYAIAAQTLYRLWWQESETRTEEQARELHRLALMAGNAEIAAEIGSVLAHRWYGQSRFREAVDLCKDTLNTAPDYRIYHALARSETTLGNVQAALQAYQQALQDCPEADGVQKAGIIHNMAGIYAQQGQVSQALELYQQSLALKESIGDVQGKAATLANMACLAGEQGDTAQQFQLNLQAAEALANIGAYPDLVTVLGNLGSKPSDQQLTYLAQALWLSLRLQISLTDMIHLIAALFQAVPKHDPLEPLLATTAYFLCATQDQAHPELESLQTLSLQMLGAAAPAGTDSTAALQTWMVEQQLNDPSLFLPRLQQLLLAAIGDRWLFDPRQVQS